MALSNSFIDEPIYLYNLLRTINAFLLIAIYITFYK